MNQIYKLPDNVPFQGTLLFLSPGRNNKNFMDSFKKIISSSVLTEDEKKLVEGLLEYFIRHYNEEVTAVTFVQRRFLEVLEAFRIGKSRVVWGIPAPRERETTVYYYDSEEEDNLLIWEKIPRSKLYKILCILLSCLARHEFVDIILIELPDYSFMENLSGNLFEQKVEEITKMEVLDLTKIQNLLVEMEVWIEATRSRLNKVKTAYATLKEWMQKKIASEFDLDLDF